MKQLGTCLLILVGATFVIAHPHFNKKVTAQLPGGVEASVSYQTVPANEEHTSNAAVGSFVTPRSPRLALSGPLTVGSITIPAGELIVGVVKNGANDWTLALYPGKLGRGEAPESSKLIKLNSMYWKSEEVIEHLAIDITAGHGKLEGRAVLTINFGTLALHGALT